MNESDFTAELGVDILCEDDWNKFKANHSLYSLIINHSHRKNALAGETYVSDFRIKRLLFSIVIMNDVSFQEWSSRKIRPDF